MVEEGRPILHPLTERQNKAQCAQCCLPCLSSLVQTPSDNRSTFLSPVVVREIFTVHYSHKQETPQCYEQTVEALMPIRT